jgi:hypothetical protein
MAKIEFNKQWIVQVFDNYIGGFVDDELFGQKEAECLLAARNRSERGERVRAVYAVPLS